MPRKKMDQELRDEKSELILDAARKVFARKGSAATMAEVAEEAGVSPEVRVRCHARIASGRKHAPSLPNPA